MHFRRRCCLKGYRELESLKRHSEYCSKHDAQRIGLPKVGSTLGFKHFSKSMKVPFVVYADFESVLEPISGCQPHPETSYANKLHKHIPSSFCYDIKCFDDSVYKQDPVTFTAEIEADTLFIDTLEQDIKNIYRQIKFSEPIDELTNIEQEQYNSTTICFICGGVEGEFSEDNDNYSKV